MKYAREIKVGVLALVCLFLLYFGFYYLKGVNIFSSVRTFHGQYEQVNGLQEQAAVYIKGYRVGQVDHIRYDFTRDTAFVVDVSVKKNIRLPKGTEMALVADGLLGGTAIELILPTGSCAVEYEEGAFLPTRVIPGLMDNLQSGVLDSVEMFITHTDSLVMTIQQQLADNHLQSALTNVDRLSSDLAVVSDGLKGLMEDKVPQIVDNVDRTMADLSEVADDIRAADVTGLLADVDSSVAAVKRALTDESSTVGKLLYDSALYNHIDATVVSVDSLVTDLKASPKRYVHFSLFGGKKDKNKK